MGRTKRKRAKKRFSKNRVITIGDTEEFQQLVKWMKHNGWSASVRLTPAVFPSSGRGLRTHKRISIGDTLVNIPSKLLMTVETASKSLFGWIFKRRVLSTQQVLAGHLILEAHLENRSFWAKYIISLPKNISTPVFKLSMETKVLPKELCSKINIMENHVSESFSELIESLEEDDNCPHCNLALIDLMTRDIFLWAWFIINSRAVYICPDRNNDHDITLSDINCLALAPYLDMFNHSNDAKVQAFVDDSDGSYQIRTLAPYTKFSEVFIHYGDHSNVKLYLEYGFIIPKNIHDTLPINFDEVYATVAQLNPGINVSKVVFNFLKGHELLTNIHLSADGLSWALKTLIYVLLFSNKVDPKIIQVKVYSVSYSESELEDIFNLGKILINQKRSRITKQIEDMTNFKNKMLAKNMSGGFLMAIDLYNEYLCVLDDCAKSLVLI